MSKTQVINERGETVACDNGIVPDGCGVNVSYFLMDSLQRAVAADSQIVTDAWGAEAGHRPGYVYPARSTRDIEARDAADGAYDASVKRLEDAWKSPSVNAPPPVSERAINTRDAAALRDQAYEDSKKRLADAWKTAR